MMINAGNVGVFAYESSSVNIASELNENYGSDSWNYVMLSQN